MDKDTSDGAWRCLDHPEYEGTRAPRAECKACFLVYEAATTCMCGNPMADHSVMDNHQPLSMLDHFKSGGPSW
jgi:hypothetical protein